MTELEWMKCEDPVEMMDASPSPEFRKLVLFACNCLRLIAQAPNSLVNVEVVANSERACDNPRLDFAEEAWDAPLNFRRIGDARMVVDNTLYLFEGEGLHHNPVLKQHVLDLIRCIFGNPFHPVSFDPSWQTETAVSIAQAAYDSREFGNLPILADALQDAGCEDELILTHLRGPSPHARGCWVLDLILGKA